MDKYQETFNTWNTLAQCYQEMFMELDIYNASYDLFCASIKRQNASILEIGCGPGNITKYLLDRHPTYRITATDVAENMIALTKENNPSATVQILDCRALDTLKDTYDGIMCGFTLPYLSDSDTAKFIQNSYALLRQDGILYLSFVGGNYKDSGFITGSTGDRTYFYYHNILDVKNMLTTQGFQLIEHMEVPYKRSEKTSEMHTILLAQK
ncbi:class I SAM-dependent methyltransferase [Dokdonia sp.]|uniref:class I SAM-dependent methyltransferase n=1 Tax=Dokdonia sp. TaxID=2024995 RepID=UPI003266DCB3